MVPGAWLRQASDNRRNRLVAVLLRGMPQPMGGKSEVKNEQHPASNQCKAKEAEIERLRNALEAIAYSGKTKTGMKEDARRALFVPQND